MWIVDFLSWDILVATSRISKRFYYFKYRFIPRFLVWFQDMGKMGLFGAKKMESNFLDNPYQRILHQLFR